MVWRSRVSLAAALGLAASMASAQVSTPVQPGSLPDLAPPPAVSAQSNPFGRVVATGDAAPGASAWARTEQAAVRLIAARTAVGDGPTVRLGLQFDLQPGWKVYWRSAGDAGYPPTIDWSGSDNLADAGMSWPVPHRFSIFGIETAGYKDQVVFPLNARPGRPGEAMQLNAAVDYLICADICIPGQAAVSLDLPAGPGEAAPTGHLIDQYAAQVPAEGRGIALEDAAVESVRQGFQLDILVRADPPLTVPDLFVEGPLPGGVRGVVSGPPEVLMAEGGRQALFRVPLTGIADPSTTDLTVTVADGTRGLETMIRPVAGVLQLPGGAVSAIDAPSLLVMAGLALLGGLILNLMPCVLPVLSLKVMGFVGHGGGDRRAVRGAFLATAAGIVVAFLALGGALIALKAAGAAIGWGIQFQQPLFLIGMIALLTLFAANLWDLFEVPLPGLVADASSGLGRPQGMWGHFGAGVFATLLATPCSAPFLGTAVGFALARGPLEIIAIFALLGLGMAIPYLAIASAPHLATRLPRPGSWMITLRKVLGGALALTAVWLLSVLAVQLDRAGMALLIGLLVLAVVLLAIRRRHLGRVRTVLGLAVAVAVALTFTAPAWQGQGARPVNDVEGQWQPFDLAAIPGLVADGKVVFVDVTADWCITCKVNKAAVLDREPVAGRLHGGGVVVPMLADWTQPDDRIANFLASHGRYGIPFNVVYGPGAPAGLILPELLTEAAVIEALDKAGGASQG